MAKNLRVSTLTIANGATVSSTLTLENNRVPLAVITPAAMTGSALTFNASDDGSTFYPLYNESSSYSVTIGTSTARHYALARQPMEGVKYFQVVSGSAEGAARTIKVISGE